MRPRALTADLKDEICRAIADGHTVVQIAKRDDMPSKVTIFEELRRDEAFASAYAMAREQQLECWEDELLEISDDMSRDIIKRPDGSEIVNSEHIARSKLRVNTRQWLMTKRMPRKYGDRVSQEISGPNGGEIPLPKDDSLTVARKVAFLLELGRQNMATGASDVPGRDGRGDAS